MIIGVGVVKQNEIMIALFWISSIVWDMMRVHWSLFFLINHYNYPCSFALKNFEPSFLMEAIPDLFSYLRTMETPHNFLQKSTPVYIDPATDTHLSLNNT